MPGEKPDSFQCGPFEVARNPDVRGLVDKLNRLREAVDQNRLQPGAGYDVSRSSGGTVLSIRPGGAGGIPAPYLHPFMLKVRQKDRQYQFFVSQGSVGNNQVLVENQESWVGFDPNVPASRIYLEAAITDLQIQSLVLRSQPAGAELRRTEIKDGRQVFARISIGLYVPTEPGKTDYRVIQNVTTNIMTPLFCFNGYPAIALTQEFTNAYYS